MGKEEWKEEEEKGEKKEGKTVRERKGGSSLLSGLALADYSIMLRFNRLHLSILYNIKSHFLWIFKGSRHKHPLSDLDVRVCRVLPDLQCLHTPPFPLSSPTPASPQLLLLGLK